ncbi:arginine/serine-rich coiled-coil protein 2-like [Forsythia ovata]|uniref:Arginine/serine-rich coiled-coil protein 2-like n=1 Tax=Forsythia ovata TaxID=205694 RepID=A0ABD1R3P5_9LAMI
MSSNKRENVGGKAEFWKPSNDTASRNYRRRSPIGGSSSPSEGSPHPERSSSPIPSSKDIAKVAGDKRRKGDGRDLDRDSSRGQYSHNGESYKDFDRYSSKSSHSNHRHEYNRRGKNVDDYDRDYSKPSSHSGRDSQNYHYSNYSRHENRPRNYPRDMDKYSRYSSDGSGHRSRDKEEDSFDKAGSGRRYANVEDIKSGNGDRDRDRKRHKEDRDGRDGKTDYRRSSGDHRSDRSPAYEELMDLRNDSSFRRDSSGRHLKEAAKRDANELDGEKYNKEEKKIHEDRDRYKERHYRELEEKSDDRKTLSSKDQESLAKNPKLYSLVPAKDAISADEKQSSTSNQTQDACETVSAKQAYVTDSDIDAAKIAAMKAAELVNRNLTGTGYMSADQKKKLLWGNKKNTTTEESAHRWDMTTFGDRERQEKFNKLMGVKGDMKAEHKPDNPDMEKQQEQLQLDLEKQYTAGLRRRDGRTVGLGL